MFSPPPGGAAGKVGIRYEDLWTVLKMLEILDGKYDSITLEPYGETGEGVEFYLKQNDLRIYHQVKRQAPNKRWTLTALESVLETFKSKLQKGDTRCVFVSGDRAHELSNFAERADRLSSAEQFKNSLSNGERQRFKQLVNEIWEVGEEQAYRWLIRIDVKEASEPSLRSQSNLQAQVLVDGSPNNVRRRLKEIADENLTGTLTETEIWHDLQHGEEVEYEPRDWSERTSIRVALQGVNEQYLRPLSNQGIFPDDTIEREEAERAFSQLQDETGPGLLTMTGEAGIGKSFAIMQVARRCEEEGILFFAFRADRIGDDVHTADQLGEEFGLPGSPVSVLAGLSGKDERCVLIVDQLDAVSLASGRSTHLFNCIDQIVQEVATLPNVRILIGCREYDRQNDPRIRRLTQGDSLSSSSSVSSDSISVTSLSETDVRDIVDQIGVDPASLNDDQIDLLSIPLYLRLFREIIGLEGDREKPLDFGFESLKDLYDRYWTEKRRVVANKYDDVRWAETLGSLSERLSEEKQLSVPQDRLDPEFERDRDILTSENVLVVDENRVTFFHETFFDYVFARFFLASDQRLLDFILDGEQALFLRAPVRQILIHFHEADFDAYLSQVDDILHNDSVRFHIRQVVLAILGKVRRPREREWEIIAPFVEDPNAPEFRWLKGILASPQWFDLLDELGRLEEWLSGQGHLEELAANILYTVRDDRPQRFAEFLFPYVERCHSGKWSNRFRSLLRFADFSASPIQDLVERLVSEGFYHDLAVERDPEAFWDLFRKRKDQQLPSETACRLTASYLTVFLQGLEDGRFKLEDEGGGLRLRRHPVFSGLRSFRGEMLSEAAEQEPAEWLQTLLPVILQYVEAFANEDEDPPIQDSVWLLHSLQFDQTAESLLLGGTIDAMETADIAILRDVIDQLAGRSFYQTARFLLVHAYRAAGQKCADEAVDFLLDCADDDGIAWVGGKRWAVRDLVEAVAPHCREERYEALENSILDHHLRLEAKEDQRSFGRNQYLLLDALPDDRISDIARRQRQEWRRKFGEIPDGPPGGTEGGVVGPPSSIAEGNVEEMSDSDWIRAIQTYDSEDNPDGHILSGGGQQLAQVLRSQAEQDPKRFSKLAEKLSDDGLTTYFTHLLWGISEGNPDLEDVMRVVRRCHDLPGRPCGRFITQPMKEHPSLDYDEDIVEIIEYYALEDSSPSGKKSNGTENSRGLLNDGINTVRGTTATAMAALIGADENRADWFWPVLEEMVEDPSLSVRACVAQALLLASNRDEERAVKLFLQLCKSEKYRFLPKSITERFLPYSFRCSLQRLQLIFQRMISSSHEDRKVQLLATRFVERFFYYKLRRFFDELLPLLCRMLNSSIDKVAQTGALHACLASLSDDRATPMARRSFTGSIPHRRGAAKVYANNLLISEYEKTCKEALTQLFDDSEEEIRDQASRCFSTLKQENESPERHTDLVKAFIQSTALTSSAQHFSTYLEEVVEIPQALAILLGERALSLNSGSETDPATSHFRKTVGELIIRAYSQVHDGEDKQQLLDLIDRFVQRHHHGVLSTLNEFERTT